MSKIWVLPWIWSLLFTKVTMLYSYSFSKMTYTCAYNLSYRPHLIIKKEFLNFNDLLTADVTNFQSNITEFYMESIDIQNIRDILDLYWYETRISRHLSAFELFFLKMKEKYYILYSFCSKNNEFSVYFRVANLDTLIWIMQTLFPLNTLFSSEDLHNFSYFWNTHAQFYFFKVKYVDGSIIPSIFFEFPKDINGSFESFISYINTNSIVKVPTQIESNLERMFNSASKTIGYTLNLQTGGIDNIYFE